MGKNFWLDYQAEKASVSLYRLFAALTQTGELENAIFSWREIART